ncbi:cell division ATP-binding protein FtsE [Kordiimonas sp. SCSIO 12603]|uniref:cell division ATP-binding protein FtsE n=1 Tax=Kordiimonas sp. SCSIO 12603 TaxID=2829596 RepID=UPI0021080B5E|nr:cell division ATP-binding protein FtsE [Kordiimonas sp. SCSIO 12603]UTW58490.1 cell division ATP-binding protein FtsE [Kordiimonas sp. SCSIO 12603]
MISFENVGMRYGMGAEVLTDVSFSLDRGSFHFLVGPSGAGKTTLLKLLYLAHRPSRGLVNFFGKDLSTLERDALPRIRRRIGVVFQDYRLFEHMTAFENVALPLRIQGAKKIQVADHVEELLSWVGLGDRMHAKPATLSGGEKQRVAIARSIINKPDLLVADEPTGNVDAEMSRRLMQLFVALNKEGTTTIVATHDEGLVKRVGAPVLRLDKGQISYTPGGKPMDPRK